MARPKISGENMAMAVRKDFNAASVHEMEVVSQFLYSVMNQSKYRMARIFRSPFNCQ